jgi:O-antigen ligase
MTGQKLARALPHSGLGTTWRRLRHALDGGSAAGIATVAAAGVVIGAATAAIHLYPVGFLLLTIPISALGLTSARRAAVAIALTSPVVALGSVEIGFHFLPCYPFIGAGLAGVIMRGEWRTLTLRVPDIALLVFGAIATTVTVANLGAYPGTTVVGATGANSVHFRPIAQLTALLAMIGLYFVIRAGIRVSDDLRAVLRALAIASLFVAAYAAYQVAGRRLGFPYTFVNERRGVTTLPVNTRYIRPNSTLPEASPLAQFAFIAFFLGVAWLLVRRPAWEWPSRRAAAVLAASSFLLIFASLSKAAWVAGAICLPAVVWQLTQRRSYAAVASVMTAGVVVILAVLRTSTRSLDVASLIDSERYVRVGYWIAAIKTTADHPLGVGVGNFPFYYPQLAPLSPRYEYLAQLADAHNLFLEAAAETGILGGALFGGFVLGLLFRGFRIATAMRGAPLRPVALALVGAYATGALMHLTYSYFYYPFEWVLAGLLGAIATPLPRAGGTGLTRAEPDDSRTGGDGSTAAAKPS